MRLGMKPISTLMRPLQTVDVANGERAQAVAERSDVTAVPAMGVIAEGMAAFVLAQAWLEKFGGDSMDEIHRNFDGYIAATGSTIPSVVHRVTVAQTMAPSSDPVAAQAAHIVLVGLPGAGKTTVGRSLSRLLGRPFLDFNDELERRAGMAVSEIFTRHGEHHFRRLELNLTQELAKSEGAILAPGGGWITVPGAMALLRPPGRIIYLRVAPEVAILRMGEGRIRRPLLQAPEPVAVLRVLSAEREPAYLQADYVIDTDHIGIELVAVQIARLVAPIGESYV